MTQTRIEKAFPKGRKNCDHCKGRLEDSPRAYSFVYRFMHMVAALTVCDVCWWKHQDAVELGTNIFIDKGLEPKRSSS